jgi:hypothetical protein
METFRNSLALIDNTGFAKQRIKALKALKPGMIESPIFDMIEKLNQLPHCFTLQCCYGHFLYKGQDDTYNLEPLPNKQSIDDVHYKIAYIALCVENSQAGVNLLNQLSKVSNIDPKNIQFGSADWFWQRQVNSYVLQVQPERLKHLDKMTLTYKEALVIEKTRNRFYNEMETLLSNLSR